MVIAVLVLTLALPTGRRISAAVTAERAQRAEQLADQGIELTRARLAEAVGPLGNRGRVDATRTGKAIVKAFQPIPGSIDERGHIHVGPVYVEPDLDEWFRLTFQLRETQPPVIHVSSRGSAGGVRATIERDIPIASIVTADGR